MLDHCLLNSNQLVFSYCRTSGHCSVASSHLDYQIQLLSMAHRSLTFAHLLHSSSICCFTSTHTVQCYMPFTCSCPLWIPFYIFLIKVIPTHLFFVFYFSQSFIYGLTSFSIIPPSWFSGFMCQVLKDSSLILPLSQPQLVPLPSPWSNCSSHILTVSLTSSALDGGL